MTQLGWLAAEHRDPPDHVEAQRWWEQAAEAGQTDAAARLALLLGETMDPPDLDAAHNWCVRALADAVKQGDDQGRRLLLTFAQRLEQKKRARDRHERIRRREIRDQE